MSSWFTDLATFPYGPASRRTSTYLSSARGGPLVHAAFTRECLTIEVAPRLHSEHVLHRLAEPFSERGPPDHIRSDNGSEFAAKAVKAGLARVGVKMLTIAPGSPWENGDNESFNGKLRDKRLDRRCGDAR